ncbi:MAG: hypothetical protein Q9227_001425 [Pyrenula ochraceoflavens]
MTDRRHLPPASDFSIEGILNAIQPDIEETIHAIAEIMGRSRLSLANEYGSHMPPQGEIRAQGRIPGENTLLPVEEASASNERLAADNVIIMDEDNSVVDGSIAGSEAYRMLERLRAVPYPRPQQPASPTSRAPNHRPHRSPSSPAILHSPTSTSRSNRPTLFARRDSNPRTLLRDASQQTLRSANASPSETYLSPNANGVGAIHPPMVSEGGYHRPLYGYEEASLFEASPEMFPQNRTNQFLKSLHRLLPVDEWGGVLAWLRGQRDGVNYVQARNATASGTLKDILTHRSGPLQPNAYAIAEED